MYSISDTLLIINSFHGARNGIHFEYNEGVENKVCVGGRGGGILWKIGKMGWGVAGPNKMKWGSKFSKNCKVTPLPYNEAQKSMYIIEVTA